MTNADKIRTMTDEELAAWLKEALAGGLEWFTAWRCYRCLDEHGGACPQPDDADCMIPYGAELMDWLKAPADN